MGGQSYRQCLAEIIQKHGRVGLYKGLTSGLVSSISLAQCHAFVHGGRNVHFCLICLIPGGCNVTQCEACTCISRAHPQPSKVPIVKACRAGISCADEQRRLQRPWLCVVRVRPLGLPGRKRWRVADARATRHHRRLRRHPRHGRHPAAGGHHAPHAGAKNSCSRTKLRLQSWAPCKRGRSSCAACRCLC